MHVGVSVSSTRRARSVRARAQTLSCSTTICTGSSVPGYVGTKVGKDRRHEYPSVTSERADRRFNRLHGHCLMWAGRVIRLNEVLNLEGMVVDRVNCVFSTAVNVGLS